MSTDHAIDIINQAARLKAVSEGSKNMSITEKHEFRKIVKSLELIASQVKTKLQDAFPMQVGEQVQPENAVGDAVPTLNLRTDLTMLDAETRLRVETASNEIATAVMQVDLAKEILSKHIYNTDAKIINISAPARVGEKLEHKLDGRIAQTFGVIGTNTEAYVITRTDQGMYSITSVQQWKSTQSVIPNKL